MVGRVPGLFLPARAAHPWIWAASAPALWALGWTATTLGVIHVEEQFTDFGAYGARTFSVLSGLLLHRLLPYRHGSPAPLNAGPDLAPR